MSTYFIHAANVLYLLSYLVRDILWLRLLTIVAGGTLLPYYCLQKPPIYAAIAWNAVFLAINLYQIQRLLLERRPVKLDATELMLYESLFPSLTTREFKQLLSVATWQDLDSGARVVAQGAAFDGLRLIVRGRLEVRVDDAAVATLESGRLIGEMSYLTGEKTSASVWVIEPSMLLAWPREPLKTFLEAHPQQRLAMQRVIGTDLVAKLRGRPPTRISADDRNEGRSSGVSPLDREKGASGDA